MGRIMRTLNSLTARLYQAGLEREDAIKQGANPVMFDALVVEFKDGSIPVHLLHGFRYITPYSGEYHCG